jgi:hypothetical protein
MPEMLHKIIEAKEKVMDKIWVVKISFLQLGEEDDEHHDFFTLDAAIDFIKDWAKKDDTEVTIWSQKYIAPSSTAYKNAPF